MKAILITLLVVGLLGGGLFWYSGKKAEERAAAKAAREAAALEAQRQERIDLFGEAALADDITWTNSGLGIQRLEEGSGPHPLPGAFVTFNYVVTLKDGKEVDRTAKPTEARIGQMISGVSSGLQQMRPGGKARLYIPPVLGYGGRSHGPIPADSGLIFEIELLPN